MEPGVSVDDTIAVQAAVYKDTQRAGKVCLVFGAGLEGQKRKAERPAAKRRIRELETGLAIDRRATELLKEQADPKAIQAIAGGARADQDFGRPRSFSTSWAGVFTDSLCMASRRSPEMRCAETPRR